MAFQSLKLKNCGPLNGLDVKFGPLNLIVGSNEEGKSTLTDLLIDELLSKAAPEGKKPREASKFLKDARRTRFEPEGLEVAWNGPAYAPADMRGLSLGVVREGEARHTVDKIDMGDSSFWRTEVRNMLFGADSSGLNQKIEQNRVNLLGISKGKGWLVKLEERLHESVTKLYQLEIQAKTHHGNRETLALMARELTEMKAKLAGLETLRKGREDADKLHALKEFFALNDEISKLEQETRGKDTAPLLADQKRWKEVSQELFALEKKLERVRGEQSKGEVYRKSLEDRLTALRVKEAALKEREKGLLESSESKMDGYAKKETGLKNRLSELNSLKTESQKSVGLSALVWAGLAGAVVSVPLFFFLFWAGPVLLVISAVIAIIGLSGDQSLKKKRGEELERLAREAEQRGRELEEAARERERDSAETGRRMGEIRAELAAIEGDIQTTEAELVPLRKGMDPAVSAEQASKSALEKAHLDFLGRYVSPEELSASIARLSELKSRFDTLSRNFQIRKEAMEHEYGDASVAFLSEIYHKLIEKSPGEAPTRFNRAEYDELTGKIERLSVEQKRLGEETEKLSGQIQSSLHAVLDALRKPAQKYEKQFYPELFDIDPREGVYAVFRVKEALETLSERIKREEGWSEVLSGSIETVLSRSDAQVMEVLSDPRFQEHLSALTANRYTSVEIAAEGQDTVLSLKNDGRHTPIEHLSSGTRNQFYLALRLTLLRRLFPDRPGVLILDDAFLTFDRDRRKSALSLFRGWLDTGWQIVYSAVQDDAMEKLFESVYGKEVNRIVLNRSAAK